MNAEEDYFVCPNCGADVATDASSCRECGASGESGWEDSPEDAIEDEFEYDEFLAREFPEHASQSPAQQLRRAAVVTIVVLVGISLVLLTILRS